jgi:hypothetical protein
MATKKSIAMPQAQAIGAIACFVKDGEDLEQYMKFRKPTKKTGENPIIFDLPLGKALKGSVIFGKDPDFNDGKHIVQKIRVYKKTKVKSTAPILESRYSRVNVSRSRVTVTMSFPICSDPARLKARMQNFANIIIDESDEIAALLNQEGDTRVQEAWKTIDQSNEEGD